MCAGLCNSSAYEQGPQKSALHVGPINLAGEREAWKQHIILRNHSQKGAESSQGECQEGEGEGDWDSVIRSGWDWKQSKTSSWLTSCT